MSCARVVGTLLGFSGIFAKLVFMLVVILHSRSRLVLINIITLVVVWHSDSELVSSSEVNLHRAELVLRWVALSGFNSWCRLFISVGNQLLRLTQPFIYPGSVNEDQLWLGRKRKV